MDRRQTETDPVSVCAAHGFDVAGMRETVAALGLPEGHAGLAERIRREVIGEGAGAIVAACVAGLAGLSEAAAFRDGPGAPDCRRAWRDRLRRFGAGIDTPAYFAEYLSLASKPAQAGLSVRLLQWQHLATQRALLEGVRDRWRRDPATARALAGCVLGVTALNLLLSVEGFHRGRILSLQGEAEATRAEIARLRRSATMDELTGAMSFGHAMEVLDRMIGGAARSGKPLCVLMADLDFFKKVNDTYGHIAGDIVLRHAGERIRAALRDTDAVGRFGGEEFVIFLANAGRDLGAAIAERIRLGIAKAPFHAKRSNIDVTISIGLAAWRPGETRQDILERADRAMYAAKRAGRNRVVVAPEDR